MLAASPRETEASPPAPCQRLALKVDVNTYRGTIEGVPRLVDVLRRHKANATFLFSLGPDHTGRGISRLPHGGYWGRLKFTAALEHYGIRPMLYGTLLPGPDIGARCADTMRMVADLGFEVGVHAWDSVLWQSTAMTADADWTHAQMQRACARFAEIFGAQPRVHGAAGWQMNVHGCRLTQRLGFDYCSDTRGFRPYIPVFNAELIACPQIPTTLPTWDELIEFDGTTADEIEENLITAAAVDLPAGHVFTLRAELEGMKLNAVFERLLSRWKEQGKTFLSLGEYIAAAGWADLPRHVVTRGPVPGTLGALALQGAEFLP